jgi:hypothetical protein
MGTGWFAADAANVTPGATVVVVGDGAVGLLSVLSAKQMGAERIIATSRHQSRQKLAREFGATDVVTERGDEGVERIKQLTNGVGADSVLEWVGTQSRCSRRSAQRALADQLATSACRRVCRWMALISSSGMFVCSAVRRRFVESATTDRSGLRREDQSPEKCSISCCPSITSPRAIGRWTSGLRSRRSSAHQAIRFSGPGRCSHHTLARAHTRRRNSDSVVCARAEAKRSVSIRLARRR